MIQYPINTWKKIYNLIWRSALWLCYSDIEHIENIDHSMMTLCMGSYRSMILSLCISEFFPCLRYSHNILQKINNLLQLSHIYPKKSNIMRLITWIILIALGATIIRYRFNIYEFTGEWDWANKYLSSTMVAIVMVGMILIGAWAAYPFGAFDGFGGTGDIVPRTSSSR